MAEYSPSQRELARQTAKWCRRNIDRLAREITKLASIPVLDLLVDPRSCRRPGCRKLTQKIWDRALELGADDLLEQLAPVDILSRNELIGRLQLLKDRCKIVLAGRQSERADKVGQKSGQQKRKFQNLPKNPEVSALATLIAREEKKAARSGNHRVNRTRIALEFTSNDKKKALILLRGVRRYPGLLPPIH
jgi:hypothetical protein